MHLLLQTPKLPSFLRLMMYCTYSSSTLLFSCSGIFGGKFGKEVCSEVLWQTILGEVDLLRTLAVLHLVNNDGDVTRAILQAAHSPHIRDLLSPCDPDGRFSPTPTRTPRDRETEQEREAGASSNWDRRSRSPPGRGLYPDSGGALLTTFEPGNDEKRSSKMPEEELVLHGGKWVPKSQLPTPVATKTAEPVEREIRLASSGKPSEPADEPRSFNPLELAGSVASSIGIALTGSGFTDPSAQPTRTELRKVESTVVVASGPTTSLVCARCKREPEAKSTEWFVQPPCNHFFCLACFNEHVQRTRDTKCPLCSQAFELPTPANKDDFNFCSNATGLSFVLNSKYPKVCISLHHLLGLAYILYIQYCKFTVYTVQYEYIHMIYNTSYS